MSQTQPRVQQQQIRQEKVEVQQGQEQTIAKTKSKKKRSRRKFREEVQSNSNGISQTQPRMQQQQIRQEKVVQQGQEQTIAKTKSKKKRSRRKFREEVQSNCNGMSQTQPRMQQQQVRQEKVEVQQGQEQTIAKTKSKKKRSRRKFRKEVQSNSIRGVKESETFSSVAGENNLAIEKKPLEPSEQNKIDMSKDIPLACRKAAGSNWEAAMVKLVLAKESKNKPNEQESVINVDGDNVSTPATTNLTKSQRRRQRLRAAQWNYVAMDCEMVGVGLYGQRDMLARVSIVNKRGEVLLDKFVKPQETVIDYRTSVSGIRPHDIINGEEMKSVQDEVVQILQGKILIGHGINKDLAVLRIKHPSSNIRDTAYYKPLRRLVANGRTPSLKRLSEAILGKEIQIGEHNSVEDARAVMSIYNCLAGDWEQYIKRHQHRSGK